MTSHDHLTLLMNFLIALPVFLFLPGYILTQTFLNVPSLCLMEKIFLRLFLSLVLSSLSLLGLAWSGFFTLQNLILAVVALSFLLFIFKRFRFSISLRGLNLLWKDFWALLVIFSSLLLMMWPAERIGQTFISGVQLAREGILPMPHFPFHLSLGTSALASAWLALTNLLFGMKLSLLVSPLFGVISALTLFFLVEKMFGLLAGLSSVTFFLTYFANLWFCRCPEGFALAQSFSLGALYFTHLAFRAGKKAFLAAAFLALILAVFARTEALIFLIFWAVGIGIQGMLSCLKVQGFRKIGMASFLTILFLIFARQKSFSPFIDFFCSCMLLMTLGGVLLFLYYEAAAGQAAFFMTAAFYPLFLMSESFNAKPLLASLAPWISCAFPILCLWIGSFLGRIARVGKVAFGVVILVLMVSAGESFYICRSLIWSKDSYGVLNFYDGLRRSFLPDDLVFSDSAQMVSILNGLYGRKVYLVNAQGLDRDFQKEIRHWLKDGGHAYLISMKKDASMDGFNIKLQSVERLKTLSLNEDIFPLEEKRLCEIMMRIYEVIPVRP